MFFIILLSLFGMGYAINKVWQVSQAGALGATIHDGVINYINVGVNSGVGVFMYPDAELACFLFPDSVLYR
jgi:hypothetical protein